MLIYNRLISSKFIALIALLVLLAGKAHGQNNPPTDIIFSSTSIIEEAQPNALVGNLTTTDQDQLDVHSYSLANGSGDIDNNHFRVSNNGHLRAKSSLNYEEKTSYSIRIETEDGNGGSYSEAVTIEVLEGRESPTNILLDDNSIPEARAVGTVVGMLSAVDEDLNETYTFRFTDTENYPSNQYFDIVGNELRSDAIFDYETRDFYSIRIEVEDSRGMFYDRSFFIIITDDQTENSPPSDIGLSNNSIAEENQIGDFIGLLSVTDPDAGDSHTYSLPAGQSDNDLFSIGGGNELHAADIFDYETETQYLINVKVTDAAGAEYQESFHIYIGDEIENSGPSFVSLSSTTIDENNDLFDMVGNFSSSDPDQGDTHTYQLVAGGGSDGNTNFRIVGDELQANTIFDYENEISYSIRVRTTDSQGNSIDTNHTIGIGDLDDLGSLDFYITNNIVTENINSPFIGTLHPLNAVNPAQVNFTLVAGDGDDDNSLVNRSGYDLSINGTPNFESKNTYSIRVEANDQGNTVQKNLIIYVTDVNEKPTTISVSTTDLPENNAVNQVVAVLSVDDPDNGDSFTFNFQDAEPQFVIDGNLIRATEVYDFESLPSGYRVALEAQDAGGLNATPRTIDFFISNRPEPPTDITLNPQLTFENGVTGTYIGDALAVDEDNGDSHSFSVVTGPDSDKFTFVDNELHGTEDFNYEEKSLYSVRIRTEDANGAAFEKDFDISVKDSNESPFDISFEGNLNINENNEIGDVIGTLQGEDPDVNPSFTYFVLATMPDGFSFDIANGNELVADEVFDFESQDSYTFEIQVRDNTNRSFTKTFTITINDIFENDAPTDIALTANSINENNAIGAVIGTLSTTDANGDDLHTYSLVSNPDQAFAVSGDELQANISFDFETENSYDITIRTSDGEEAYDEDFTITINDTAENQAPTAIALSSASIQENNDINDVIGSLTTTDANAGDTHTYSLEINPENAFVLDGDELQANTTFDFETEDEYSITIRTDDGISTYDEDFTITISDGNDDPTDISLSNSTIEENNTIGDAIGTLSSTDEDGNDTHSYFMANNPNGHFSITGDQLMANSAFNFEQQSSHEISIQTDDGTSTFIKTFSITIADGNDTPATLTLSNSSITENNSVGALVGLLGTEDEDTNDTHEFSFLSNPGNAFGIDGNQLTANLIFDFEVQSSYPITLRVSDGESTFQKDFTISIVNQGENLPPTDIVVGVTSIDENNEIGDVISQLTTTDGNAGDTHTYQLVSNPGFLFRIVNDELQANAYFNFESQDSYPIRISTSDGQETFEKDFTITINDVNEAPTNIGLTNTSIVEGNSIGDLIGIISSSDPDAGNTLTYTLTSNPGNAFAIDDNRLEANSIFDFESQSSFAITIQVNDGANNFSKDFTITIVAEEDATGPEIISFSPPNAATGILQTQLLTATFNEPIKFGSGQVKVIRAGGSGQEVVNLRGGQGDDVLSIDGSTLTIDLNGDDRFRDLFFGAEYYVNIQTNAIQDLNSNPTGNPILDETTWTFFAEKEPTVFDIDPIDDKFANASPFDVSVTSNNIQAALVYEVLDGPATNDGNTISLTGETGIVVIEISQNESQRFKSQTETISFEVLPTPDTTPPTVVSFSPAQITDLMEIDGELNIVFSEAIQIGQSEIRVRLISGNAIVTRTGDSFPDVFEINGNTMTIFMDNPNVGVFEYGEVYYVEILPDAIQDLNGNSFNQSFTGNTHWRFEIKVPPHITQYTPVTGSSITKDQEISFRVNNDINFANGEVLLKHYDSDQIAQTITVSSANIQSPGNKISLDFDLEETNHYYISFAEGVFEDEFGSTFELADKEAWNFTVPDATGPEVVSFSPLTGSTNVALDDELTIVFDEEVQVGARNVLVRKVEDDELITRTGTSFPDAFEINGNTMTVFLSDPNLGVFEHSTEYYVEIIPDAIQDLHGNSFDQSFTGNSHWRFTTEPEAIALPEITKFTPKSGISIDPDAVIRFTLNNDVTHANGNVHLNNYDTDQIAQTITVTSANITSSNEVTLDFGTLDESVHYYITFSANVFEDQYGSTFEITDKDTWHFTTLDVTNPAIASLSPVNGAVEVALDADLVLTFSEPITASAGQVRVKKMSNASVVLSGQPIVSDDLFTISGNDLTIHLSEVDLEPGTGYYVQVDPNAIADLSGNFFDGIADNTSTWSFTTVKGSQTISFEAVTNKLPTDAAFDLNVSSDADLDVTLSITGPATLGGQDGKTITLTGAEGEVVITASQAGNSAYHAADDVSISFQVTATPLSVISEMTLSVYPNPASSILNITGENLQSITFYDLAGQWIKSLKITSSRVVNIEDLQTGAYLIRIKTKEGERIIRMVKN